MGMVKKRIKEMNFICIYHCPFIGYIFNYVTGQDDIHTWASLSQQCFVHNQTHTCQIDNSDGPNTWAGRTTNTCTLCILLDILFDIFVSNLSTAAYN